MREVIAICRSGKKSRVRTAQVLDRYFWRIGDRTWRGKATNACLDRVARELRRKATRNTAVTIHEIRSTKSSRLPLIRIGSRTAFSEDGLVPIAVHPTAAQRSITGSHAEVCAGAIVRIAALFHDLGKATRLFQKKLRSALKKDAVNTADPIRHELFSAMVWDNLVGDVEDSEICQVLSNLTPNAVDRGCDKAAGGLSDLYKNPENEIPFRFLGREGTISHVVGMLILTHHRLPDCLSWNHTTVVARRHVNAKAPFHRNDLLVAEGKRFWHENWWMRRLLRDAKLLTSGNNISNVDIALRGALMLADHLGSAHKEMSEEIPDHLANTMKNDGRTVAGDSLAKHVHRVYANARGTFNLFHRYRDRFPALLANQIPTEIIFPLPSTNPRFGWQANAADAVRSMCEKKEGGFFACVLSGTGTGKTRGAPTILASAALNDARPERRYFRPNLCLGLRVLATQSANVYVDDLGFRDEDVSVLIGQPPILFADEQEESSTDRSGSASLIKLPEWLRVEQAVGSVPKEGSKRETDWLRGLSLDTDRGLPAYCDLVFETAGEREGNARRFLAAPIIVGTIDHFMAVAQPVNSRFLIPSIRLLTSDLILDEIDQFDGEDIAAICRLIFQAGVGGRRVIIMSATLTTDIATALHEAYVRGWAAYAQYQNQSSHINLLCTGDALGSCFTNGEGQSFNEIMANSRRMALKGIHMAAHERRGEIGAPCETWNELVEQTDRDCSRFHEKTAAMIEGFRVSCGMIRMTRIAHTAAMATQLPSGRLCDRAPLRLRVKLCLHAQFPRLLRAWIETRLKRALTRNGSNPNVGLTALCLREGLFRRACEIGASDIEIVVITSPVIETGNDLDFDYAVVDPISIRAIIQAAGRVQRHRVGGCSHTNVLILGRSPIAMERGDLSFPGVETPPHKDTKVKRECLARFPKRLFNDLAGDAKFLKVTAEPLLSGEGTVPLRDAEENLRRTMIDTSEVQPLGKYLDRLNARFNLAMTRSRKFRRSNSQDILYRMIGEDIEGAEWYHNLAPGLRYSTFRPAENLCLEIGKQGAILFENPVRSAWEEYWERGSHENSQAALRTLMQVQIPDHEKNDVVGPQMTYSDFTGFTRGEPKDLFGPFGKTVQN